MEKSKWATWLGTILGIWATLVFVWCSIQTFKWIEGWFS